MAGQQDLANNSTLANLNSSNYSQALSEANTQQQTQLSADQANRAALQSGSQLESGLGSLASSTGIANANAQLQGGVLQQQTQQAGDTAQYGQFQNAQAFPYQQADFLTSNTSALAPELGSSTYGQQTQSAPSIFNSVVGGGLALAGLVPKARSGAVSLANVPHIPHRGRTLADCRIAQPLGTGGRTLADVRYTPPGDAPRKLTLADVRPYAQGGSARLRNLGDLDLRSFARGGAASQQMTLANCPVVRRADGGMAAQPYGGGSMPYSGAQGYIPTANLGTAHLLQGSSGMGGGAQQQQSNTLGGTGAGSNFMQGAKLFANSSTGTSLVDGVQDTIQNTDYLARGGAVSYDERVSAGARALMAQLEAYSKEPPPMILADLRIKRGYDDGGVVSPDAMMFDPNAVTPEANFMQPSLANVTMPGRDPLPGLGSVKAAPAAPPTNTLATVTAPVPVAPAPVTTPQVSGGYMGGDDGGGTSAPSPATGLGAINAVAPPYDDPLGGYNARVRAIESKGGQNIPNAQGSGATGPYQFMPNTWSDVASKHPELGLTSDGINDPRQQEKAMTAFTADNAAAMTKALGRPPTQDELYLAHQQGAAGAIGLLTDPNSRASDVVGTAAVVQNGGSPNMTAGQFANMWKANFNGASPTLGNAMAFSGDTGSGGLGGASLANVRAASCLVPG